MTRYDGPDPTERQGRDSFDQVGQIVALEQQAREYRRLIRWLSLTYGTNLPIFHGPDKQALIDTYCQALDEDDGDPAFWYAAKVATSRPEPSPPEDWGDTPVERVVIDNRGNTVATEKDWLDTQMAITRKRRWWLRG